MDDVERLAVTADRGVRGVQRVRDLRADVGRQRLRQRRVLTAGELERAAERDAVHELEHEHRPVLLGLQVVGGGHDPRVAQGADHPGLVGEHGRDPRVSPALRRQHLEHHPPAERAGSFELGEPDFTHAPESQPLLENIPPADPLARLEHASLTHPFRSLL